MALTNGTHRDADHAVAQELEQLRAENEELRSLVLELEQALQNSAGGDQDWEARSREYESLLEEKSELIRNLHRKVQMLEEELGAQEEQPRKPSGPVPREEELMMLSEEL